MADKWFVFDQGCIDTFFTEEEALKDMEEKLDEYRAEAGEGWDEEVESIVMGEIKKVISEASRVDITDENRDEYFFVDSGIDQIVEYAVTDV